MTKAPERIWATMMDPEIARNGTFVDREDYPSKPNADAVEYIRADLVPQWKPIGTAPKDGIFILSTESGSVIPDGENWLETEFECFFSDTCGRIYDTTHWMPLPEPPKF